jgi:ABC-type antimicrobial peptide transport system permease subunit
MHYYVPFAQGLQAPPWMVPWAMANGILLRKQPAIDLSAQSIRDTVAGGRGDLPFLDVQPYASFDRPRLAHWLVGTQLLLLFGALALLTTALGLYAAFAHAVTERRMEMAIRLAVGASRQRVLLMLLREAMVITARGAINGFVVAALVGWAARSMIFGLSSPGALVIAVVSGVVLIASFVGTWFPALAAARVEPNALLKID